MHNIYLVMICEFTLPKSKQIWKSVLCNSAIKWVFLFQNNHKDLDPSYKMDLGFCGCFGGEKKDLIIKKIQYVILF